MAPSVISSTEGMVIDELRLEDAGWSRTGMSGSCKEGIQEKNVARECANSNC